MFTGQKSGVSEHLALGACLTLAVLAFVRPGDAAAGAAAGLSLCARSVIPAIFPLLVLSQILLSSRAAAVCALPFRPYLTLLHIDLPQAATAMALGWLGGFACGAQSIGKLRLSHLLTRRDAELLLCCTAGSGPAFVVGAVGTLMLGNTASGAVLLAALLLANLGTGLVMNLFLPKDGNVSKGHADYVSPGFADAIRQSVQSMLTLCGFVVFFAFSCAVLLPKNADTILRWLIAALLEVTNACSAAATGGTSLRFYLCCAALSAMGGSVFLQIRSLVPRDVRILPLVASRLVHMPLSLMFSRLLLMWFPGAAAASVPARLWMPFDAATAVFLMLCVTLASSPGLRREKKGV